jgi:hypothetical protein
MITYRVNKSYIDESNKSRVVKEDGEFVFLKVKPCKDCGSEEIKTYYKDNSQYCVCECFGCGKKTPEGMYFKDCDLEGLDDDDLAMIEWDGKN